MLILFSTILLIWALCAGTFIGLTLPNKEEEATIVVAVFGGPLALVGLLGYWIATSAKEQILK